MQRHGSTCDEIRFRHSTPSRRFAYAHRCGMTMGYGIIRKVLLRRTKAPAMTRDNHNSE